MLDIDDGALVAVDFGASAELATTKDLRRGCGAEREGVKLMRDEDARAMFSSLFGSINPHPQHNTTQHYTREISTFLFVFEGENVITNSSWQNCIRVL